MRNNLGIITTPQVEIGSYVGSTTTYTGTPLEPIVDSVIKSIKERKLLCVDLSSVNYKMFGIVTLVYDKFFIYFELGCHAEDLSSACKFSFAISLSNKQFSVTQVEI